MTGFDNITPIDITTTTTTTTTTTSVVTMFIFEQARETLKKRVCLLFGWLFCDPLIGLKV
jgi:hypothetical protein